MELRSDVERVQYKDELLEELEKNEKLHSDIMDNLTGERYYEADENYYTNTPEDDLADLGRKIDIIRSQIRGIEFAEEEVRRKNHMKNFMKKEDSYLISDADTLTDTLSRKQYADSIAELISKNETQPPVTIGIYGNWGEGKSVFLKLIEENLKENNKKLEETPEIKEKFSKIQLVKFDASEYDEQETIWFSLLNQMFTACEKEMGFKGISKYKWNIFRDWFKTQKLSISLNSIALAFFIYWLFYVNRDNALLDAIQNNDLSTNFFGAFSSFIVLSNIIIPFIKEFKILTKPITDRVNMHLKLPNYRIKLGNRELIKEDLRRLIKTWLINNNEKIVVFIDELDRCSNKTIVEFFNALQLFIQNEKIIFVISVNYETICYALAENNKFVFEGNISNKDKLAFGEEYLQKYITIPFFLPKQQGYDYFIKSILKKQSIFSDDDRKTFTKMINEILGSIHINPREMKKILNLLILSKDRMYYLNQQKDTSKTLLFDEYLRWFLFQHFNPNSSKKIISLLSGSTIKKTDAYKTMKEIRPLYTANDIKFDPTEKATDYFLSLLDTIQIEYILFANSISRSFVMKFDEVSEYS